MRKVIAAINMTIDGFCDHTAILPDEEIHRHYEELLNDCGVTLYGRTTYQLMEFWQTFLEEPSEDPSMNDFAVAIDKIPKIVFSHTLQNTGPITNGWDSASLAKRTLEEEVLELKQQSGKAILIGSRSLIIQLLKLHLIDELQLCIHPVFAGKGLPLFENMTERAILELTKTKTLQSGGVILYYKTTGKRTINP